jgi:adenosine deaminase
MLDKGLMVTVNSDDPAYFGGYVNDNYRAVSDALGLTATRSSRLSQRNPGFADDGRGEG